MLAVGVSDRARPASGLRRLDLRTDLGQVADLLDLAFREEKRDSPVPLTASFAAVRSMAPFLWMAAPVMPSMANMFSGYVWTEDGRVVGNINVSRTDWSRDVWLIGNVAVHPAWRRRRIARSLTMAALDHVDRSGGRLAVLDVRDDNARAYPLYEGLGFRRAGGGREWFLTASALRRGRVFRVPGAGLIPGGLAVDQRVQAEAVWQLVERIEPAGQLLARGLKRRAYVPNLLDRIQQWLARPLMGGAAASIGVRDGSRLVAWCGVDSMPGRMATRLRLVVDPLYRGAVEPALVELAMERVEAAPAMDCWAQLWLDDLPASDALRGFDFQPTETLHRLVVSFPA